MLAEFDPLGNKKVEGSASLNLDVKFTGVIFASTRQDDKGTLLGEDVRIAIRYFAWDASNELRTS
jgi:hypothetical protein